MTSDDLVASLRELVGNEGPLQVARHAVNTAAIADWCDAIGDRNPRYPEIAPTATLDIWDRPGLPGQSAEYRNRDTPQSRALRLLERNGFVGVVAVNSELEVTRALRPGDMVHNVQVLEDVSAEKQTALGVGHFVTTRHRYTTTGGEHVGDLRFRVLKFKPGTARAGGSPESPAAPPLDSSPDARPRPGINLDNEALWDGYRKHELRIPQCNRCTTMVFPPSPRCARCGAFDMGYAVASGRGTLYSFVSVHHPKAPGFDYPVPVGLVELDEGVRMVADLVGVTSAQLSVGMPLEVDWLDSHPALVDGATDSRGPITLARFRPAPPVPRTDTVTASSLAVGETLPLWVLPVTPTLIVAGALATRDFQDVHHDRDLAHKKGSKDIFLNINTSLGLMQRFVTDWAGPDAFVRALRVRLGAPAYPYAPLTFTGSVGSVDAATGAVEVAVTATNALGAHVTGTVELEVAP
ncbi:MAG TPA: OB-fold domain-containing protein [Mycobacteriales bacterium]|nr:OB-fold domain-containing protein [Mycobacteriales bacterium]